ncbi:MAG: DUF2807 domain-containing protein [Bacteroidetes bacterium]|nr:DUF2807 domain-containing protein [Bacteroidota bacterium]
MFQEKKQLPEFHGIFLRGIGNVFVHQGDEHSIRVESNQDLSGRIRAEVRNDELEISFYDTIPVWLISFPRLDIHITLKQLNSIRMAGVGRMSTPQMIKADTIHLVNSGVGGLMVDVEAETVITTLKGVGEIQVRGKSVKHDVEISGTGKVDAGQLEAENVRVQSRGVGECTVNAKVKLEIEASGIGKVRYRGNPEVTSRQTGLGSIERIP